MSGNYDPTNMRDDRHPLRALGMAFGQRQAMDQQYQEAQPQYQQAPLAQQLRAPAPMLGPQGFGGAAAASPLAGAGNMGQQIGKGALGLYEWARGPQQNLGTMDAKAAELGQMYPPTQGGFY